MKLIVSFAYFLFITYALAQKSSSDISIRVYEVDERNSVQKVVESIPNTEVVLDGVRRIRLECVAPFPVQWVYSGNGVPSLSSTIRKETDEKFTASAFITALKESHSGRYECFSTESPHLANAHFFIYVPGSNIFTIGDDAGDERRQKIYIPKNDSNLRIPCAVSNPKIPVVLERSIGDVLVSIKPATGSRPPYTYDPKTGFILDLRQTLNPEGIYVCTAYDKIGKKTIEFDIVYPTGNSGQVTSTPPERFGVGEKDEQGLVRCSTHTDCPPNWSCYTDLKCRDPCIYSIRCGTGAICKYNDRRPYCECPNKDYVGNPMISCFNTLQNSEPVTTPSNRRPAPTNPYTTKSPSSAGSQCKVNEHCSSTHICLNGYCLDACAVKICDKNAYCVTSRDRIARCICNPGFYGGENGRDCIPSKLKSEQSDAPAAATAPIIIRIGSKCNHNRECPTNSVCRTTRPQNPPICTEICGSKVCGENAYCQNGACLCQNKYYGNPELFCIQELNINNPTSSKLIKDGNNECLVDNDCLESKSCQSFASFRKCLDPCLSKRCPYNTECKAVKHTPVCTCPNGTTGSILVGCTANVETEFSEFRRRPENFRKISPSAVVKQTAPAAENLQIGVEVTTQSALLHPNCSTTQLGCGPNSECRLVDGEARCFCGAGYVGEVPKCKKECVFNVECPAEKICIQNRCRNACRNKCGKNTRCKVNSGPSRAHECECREGFIGNAYSQDGCYPIRDHK